jgi:hypothetical protein
MAKKRAQIMGVGLIAPFVSIALLGGIAAENATHLKPADVEPFHANAKAAIEGVPSLIDMWTGKNEEIPPAAQKLLRNPVILNRTYIDNEVGRRRDRRATFLIVQCRDSRDMVGHYPPICYRAHGDEMVSEQKRDWTAKGRVIPGTQYEFKRTFGGQSVRRVVYNFIVIPGVGVVRDMQGIYDASEDYQQRYYGAAQFQLVMSGDLPSEERDEIFEALIGPNLSVIDTLATRGAPQPTTMPSKSATASASPLKSTGPAGGNVR